MVLSPYSRLRQHVEDVGCLPVTWVRGRGYANLGDALSPIMVALLTDTPIRHAALGSKGPRLSAVGTIAHGFRGGDVWVWGSGSSRYTNPFASVDQRRIFDPTSARFRVLATRGPVSRRILGDPADAGGPRYGDPVWILPQFYPRPPETDCELGVIVHLSDIDGRQPDSGPRPVHRRYAIPESLRGKVRIINTISRPDLDGLRENLNEILSCKRLVSTSLHGMVFAESYGIPCLYFSPRGAKPGVRRFDLADEESLDLRLVDLYRGLGRDTLNAFVQPRKLETDWEALIEIIDRIWEPVECNCEPLIEAFPLPLKPLIAPEGTTIFEHPRLRGFAFQDQPADPIGKAVSWRGWRSRLGRAKRR